MVLRLQDAMGKVTILRTFDSNAAHLNPRGSPPKGPISTNNNLRQVILKAMTKRTRPDVPVVATSEKKKGLVPRSTKHKYTLFRIYLRLSDWHTARGS